MFFKNRYLIYIFYSIILIIFGFLFIIIMTSCTESQKQEYYEDNGKEKAFCHYYNEIIHLQNNSIAYNINIDKNSRYYSVAEASIYEANKFSNLSISSTYTYTGNSINIASLNNDNILAKNTITYNPDNKAEIKNSNIYYNTDKLEKQPIQLLKHVAIHEMGHTLGLADLYDAAIADYSIMYHEMGYGSNFSTFQEYDIANVLWYYGGEYNEL